jgi:hypothetical protein
MNLIRMTALAAIFFQTATTAALATQIAIGGMNSTTKAANVVTSVVAPRPTRTNVRPARTLLILNLDGSVSQIAR